MKTPTISVYNRQRRVRFPLAWLRRVAEEALGLCLGESADGRFALAQLGEVEVSVVSDAVIARVHKEFMGIEGATDVITFDHGEIVVSAETAVANAGEFGGAVEEELALYVVHGLLHLNGFTDDRAAQARKMDRVQQRLLRVCLEKNPTPQNL